MSDININAQSLPNRCEICHQSDCFDPATNYCSRCADSNAASNINAPVPSGKINIHFDMQHSDLNHAQWAAMTRRWYSWIWLAAFTVLPIYLLTLTLINWSNTSWGSLLTTLFPVLTFILVIVSKIFITNRRRLKTYKALQQTIRYSFAFDGFDVSAGKTFSHSSWDSLWKAIETSKSFLLYHNNAVFNLVPKRCFTNNDEIEKFREILRSNLDKKALLLTNQLSFYQRPRFGFGVYALLVTIGLTFSCYNSYSLYQGLRIENLGKEARKLMLNSNFLEAEQKYRQIIALQPNSEARYETLGNCLFQAGKFNEAAVEFRNALKLSPKSIRILQWLGAIAIQLKDNNSALDSYQQVLAIEPNNINCRYQVGFIYNLMDQRPQAIEQFQKVIELDSNSVYSHIARDYIDGKLEKINLDTIDDYDDDE